MRKKILFKVWKKEKVMCSYSREYYIASKKEKEPVVTKLNE